jgi:hypothetical protein
MFKFEITIGWLGTSTVTVETSDFDHIEVLKEFIEFQEDAGWIGSWDEVEAEDEEGEEEGKEETEEVTEEEVTE